MKTEPETRDEPHTRGGAVMTAWSGAALEYALGVVAVALSIVIAGVLRDHVVEPDLVMIFLLGVALVAFWVRLGPALATALLSVAAYNFFFVAPEFTFEVADARYLITFSVMAGMGVVLSSLTARLRLQAARARAREARTTALYRLSHELVGTDEIDTLAAAAARSIRAAFDCEVSVFLSSAEEDARPAVALRIGERGAAELSAASGARALARGEGGEGERDDPFTIRLPLVGARSQLGVIIVRAREPLLDRDQRRLLGTFVGQVALALERTRMAAARKEAEMAAETERLRNTLLSSVSHDLRTPLGSIMGSATTLLDRDAYIEPDVRRELLAAIHEEADRLSRLLNNLLAMTRIEGGNFKIDVDWQVPEEIIGAALRRFARRAHGRAIRVESSPDVELVEFDGLLIDLVLGNLIENAIKYTPDDAPIELRVYKKPDEVCFEVRDRGPGVPEAERARVFTKFYRGKDAGKIAGTGLGLAICRAVVEAHGGRIWVAARDDGPGAVFGFTIPASSSPPGALELLDESEMITP